MTLTSHVEALTDINKERRLSALREDLAIAFRECGPRLLNRHPKYGERFFIIADKNTVLDRDVCNKQGQVHRSTLMERLTDKQVNELIRQLRSEGYQISLVEKGDSDVYGRWFKFKTIYYQGDSK